MSTKLFLEGRSALNATCSEALRSRSSAGPSGQTCCSSGGSAMGELIEARLVFFRHSKPRSCFARCACNLDGLIRANRFADSRGSPDLPESPEGS